MTNFAEPTVPHLPDEERLSTGRRESGRNTRASAATLEQQPTPALGDLDEHGNERLPRMSPARTVRKGDQPLPSAGQIDVGPAVVKDVLPFAGFRSEGIVEAVAEDFRARIALGIERYGHPLQTHNGRDAAEDAYQELLDAAHYLKQLHLETRNPRAWLAYGSVLGLVFDLKEFMLIRVLEAVAEAPVASKENP